jgi:WD40 repeat protein
MEPCPPEDRFLDLLAGALSIASETVVRTHVDHCARCHKALVELVRGRAAVAEPDAEQPPVIDPAHYRIEEEFARGGMGTILRARDRRLGRFVALKQMWLQDPQAQERLRREALITARLQHPSIVPVYEAGRWPNGELFYAMKLVSGRSLAEVIAETHTLEDRLVLVPHVIAVAEAAAYAHSEGIIHRDLKPANVVIGPFAETVIIDWGLAKVLGENAAVPDEALLPVSCDALTVHGAVMGTPAYMPFEQASGGEVDARADVYAIGAILYHVLAGKPPFEGTIRDIIERVVAVGPSPLEDRQPGVPTDLAAIVRKAMAREPGDRYPTARELAQDLQRFQAGRLVSARRYSRRELLVRWLARRRLATAVAAVLLTILAVTVAVSVRGIRQSRDLAAARRDDLILAQARATLAQDPTGALAWIKTYPATGVAQGKARSLAVEAASRGVARSVKHMLGAPGVKIRFSGDGRFLAGGGRLWDLARSEDHILSDDYAAMWSGVLFTPSWLVVGGIGQAVRMWDLRTLAQRRIGSDGGATATAGFDLSPDATTLATVSEDGVVHLWDVASGTERRLGVASKDVWYVVYAPDGTRLATVTGDDGTVRVWELSSGTHRVLAIGSAAIRALAWLPDSRTLVTSSEDLAVRLTDVADGTSREIVRGDRFAWDVATSRDGRELAAGWGDGRVSLTHLPDGETHWLRGHTETVTAVAFSPDGGLLASGSRDHTVRLWELASGIPRILRGHEDTIGEVVFSPDGDTLASTSNDGQVRRWPTRDASRFVPVPSGSYTTAWHSADGRWFATGTARGNLYLHDLTTGATRELVGHTQRMGPLAFSADARWLASGSSDGDVRLWDVAQGTGQLLGNVGAQVSGVDVSPDGGTVAVGGAAGGALVVWSTADRQMRWRRSIPAGIGSLAFCPDGRSLAVGDLAGNLTLWDIATGVPRILSHGETISAVSFSPDGRWLASAELTAIRLTEVSTGDNRLLRGHTKRVQSLVFSPDGRQLASGGEDRLVWLWDVRAGTGRGLVGHEHNIVNLAFSADGTRLASSSAAENKIWIWDTALGIERRILPVPDLRTLEFSFSSDGRRLSVFGSRGIRTWDLDPGVEVPASGRIGPWLDAQTDARIGAEDRVE